MPCVIPGPRNSPSLSIRSAPDVSALTREVDMLLVFGGDGTMLRVAREMHGAATPILGINIGGLGFLTDVNSSHLRPALQQVWDGELHWRAVRCSTPEAFAARGRFGSRR